MANETITGPNLMGHITYQELPIGCTFIGKSPFTISTGMWRYARPEMRKKISPCTEACLIGQDIRKWIKFLRKGEIDKACDAVFEENPFPGIVSRVCSHPCEDACNRKQYDDALIVHDIERYISDWAILNKYKIAPLALRDKKCNIGIIGSGPAGLACAYFLCRMGHLVTVYEALSVTGGMLRTGIPEYRLPKNIVDEEIKRIQDMGVKIETNIRVGTDISFNTLKEKHDSLFIAQGFEISSHLNIEEGDFNKVLYGLPFLKQINSGQLPEFSGSVAIIGGGNVAVDCARSAKRINNPDVQLFCLESVDEIPAFPDEISEAMEEGIVFNFSVAPQNIEIASGVNQIKFIKVLSEKSDDRKVLSFSPIKGTEFYEKFDYVIIAVGQTSNIDYLSKAVDICGNKIVIDDQCMTSENGIFAGGDIAEKVISVPASIASGKRAAIFMDQYLSGKKRLSGAKPGDKSQVMSIREYLGNDDSKNKPSRQQTIEFERINTAYFDRQIKEKTEKITVSERIKSFSEVNLTLSEKKMLSEANRCFTCGDCSACDTCLIFCPDMAINKNRDTLNNDIDYQFCKGCGICVNECPTGYIDLEKEK